MQEVQENQDNAKQQSNVPQMIGNISSIQIHNLQVNSS